MKSYTESRPKRKPTPASPRNISRRNLPPPSIDPPERDQGNTAPLINTSPTPSRDRACLDLNACLDMPEWEDPMDRLDANEPDQPLTPVEKILSLVGPAVLLDVRRGSKAPTKKAWQQMALSDMTPEYITGLTNNIGVSLGVASGGLFTIDCDDDERFQEILAINPVLEGTLQSHGARGGNFWLRIEGHAPKSGKLKDSDGAAVGEWRGDGNQTLLHGIHPSGVRYRHNDTPVITVPFSEIVWPESWKLPWVDRGEVADASTAASTVSQEVEGGPKPRLVVECMLNSIPPRPDRDTWMKISAAVRNSLGNDAAAIEMLKAWSPEEEVGEYQQLLSSPFDKIGYGTLFDHAKQHGFRGVTDRFFYNGRTFYMRGDTEFIPLGSEGAVKQHITKFGVPKVHHNDLLCYIREHHFMHHIGPLAGYGFGVHYFEGTRALVTTGPNIISGAQGSADFIDRFLLTLLHDESHPEQFPTFLNWLAYCRRAVIEGRRRQSPAVALTGGIGYGKTLTIDIIRKCLGGRSAKAYRFLSGDTHFNAEIVGAELLVVDDDAASKDHRARVRLAQSIKTNLFSGSVRIEGKGRDAYSLDPIQAILFAVNDDPEHIRVLPELDDSMLDKICLLKTNPGEIPEDIRGQEELIGAAVDAALPGFLFELDARDLSGAYAQSGRLRCFWHPEIVQAIGLLSPEQQLRELIYQLHEVQGAIAEEGRWVGTAANLQGLLTCPGCMHYHVARTLLSWPGACGTFMSRLAARQGSGITRGGLDVSRTQLYAIEAVACENQAVEGGEVRS